MCGPDGIRNGTGLFVLDADRRPDLRVDPVRRHGAALVWAAAFAPELTIGGLPGRGVADDREHGLAVALHERRPDPLDVGQLGERARPQRGDRSPACCCGRPCRRACRRWRATRHSRSVSSSPASAGSSGAASWRRERLRSSGVSDAGSGRPIVPGSQTSQQRPDRRSARRRSPKWSSSVAPAALARGRAERLDRAVRTPRAIARRAADRRDLAGAGRGRRTSRAAGRAGAGSSGHSPARSAMPRQTRSRSERGASITVASPSLAASQPPHVREHVVGLDGVALDEVDQPAQVGAAGQQDRARGVAVAPAAAHLLVVGLDALGDRPVDRPRGRRPCRRPSRTRWWRPRSRRRPP